MSGEERMREYERRLRETAIPTTRISGSGRVHVEGIGDIRIAGSGLVSSEEIRISGSGSLPGGIKVKRIDCSGAVSANGDVEAEEMEFSGSASIAGDVKATSLSASGSISVDGDVRGSSVDTSGSCRFGGRVELEDTLRACGSSRFSNDVKAKNVVRLEGCFKVEGKVITGDFEAELVRSESQVRGGIEAVNVNVRRGERVGRFKLFGIRIPLYKVIYEGRLSTTDIAAKGNVYLENVSCENVCGKDVTIGEGCLIRGKVKYFGSISVHPTAKLANPPERIEVKE